MMSGRERQNDFEAKKCKSLSSKKSQISITILTRHKLLSSCVALSILHLLVTSGEIHSGLLSVEPFCLKTKITHIKQSKLRNSLNETI
jgi:hypothetical protein